MQLCVCGSSSPCSNDNRSGQGLAFGTLSPIRLAFLPAAATAARRDRTVYPSPVVVCCCNAYTAATVPPATQILQLQQNAAVQQRKTTRPRTQRTGRTRTQKDWQLTLCKQTNRQMRIIGFISIRCRARQAGTKAIYSRALATPLHHGAPENTGEVSYSHHYYLESKGLPVVLPCWYMSSACQRCRRP